jgi:hypothetical protein
MKPFKIAQYTFTLGENTERQERGRKTLIASKNRALYGDDNPFGSPLERRAAIESLNPFYSDIIGACRALDGDPEHPQLIEFLASPVAWDDFYWENYDQHFAEFVEAVKYTQGLHSALWYPKPQVTDEDAPEAAAVLQQALAAIDPDNPSDALPPDTEEIRAAVKERNAVADEKRGEDFLGS